MKNDMGEGLQMPEDIPPRFRNGDRVRSIVTGNRYTVTKDCRYGDSLIWIDSPLVRNMGVKMVRKTR